MTGTTRNEHGVDMLALGVLRAHLRVMYRVDVESRVLPKKKYVDILDAIQSYVSTFNEETAAHLRAVLLEHGYTTHGVFKDG